MTAAALPGSVWDARWTRRACVGVGQWPPVKVMVLRGADLYGVGFVIDGTPPAGGKSPIGMDAKSLEICPALARKARA